MGYHNITKGLRWLSMVQENSSRFSGSNAKHSVPALKIMLPGNSTIYLSAQKVSVNFCIDLTTKMFVLEYRVEPD